MKNFFRFLMAVAVLFTASCAKEDVSSSIAGGEVEVTFSAALPELGTRAGEGNHANVLRYFVFDAATGEKLDALCDETPTIGNGKFSFTLAMLKGMKYNIALWADCDKLYSIDDNGQNVTISYQNANDDSRDAFSAYIESFDPLSDTPSFLLYRPFAQLNALVVDSDIDVVANNEVDLTTSTITVNTYTQFNLFSQDVAGNEQPVTFTATAMPKDTTLKSGYTNLSMNYLLVPKAGMISNVDFVFNGNIAGSPFTFEQTSYKNVPFKQNYRTNILGALLSQSKEFTVEIKPAFNESEQTIATDTKALQAALDSAKEGDVIYLKSNVNYGVVYMGRPTADNDTVMYCGTHDFSTTDAEEFKTHLADGAYHTTPKYTTTLKNVTIVGATGATVAGLVATSGHAYGEVYDYVLDVKKSGSGYYNTLNMENITFSKVAFTGNVNINTSDATSVYNGVTFDNCTFTTGGTASSNGAAIRYYNEANNGNVKNIVVNKCSFNNCYQGVYTHHINGITVTECTFNTTGHNAIALQGHDGAVNFKDVVISGNNFNNINDRIIRFNEIGADSNITITNNTATNSGDGAGEVIKATSIAAGVITSISDNNWGAGTVVVNNELKDPVTGAVTVPDNNTQDVIVSAGTTQVTVPAAAAQAGENYKVVVSNENTATDSVTGETTVAFDLTLYKDNVKVSGDVVYEVTKNIGAGLFISEVTHNGTALTKDTTGADQTYTYDAATGVLTIYTKTFSPFAVTYANYKDYERKLNIAHNKYSTISVSTGGDLLPIVAVNPEIYGHSVYDGDTRITDKVIFRFSDVKKETISENSYKVSFILAVKDANGNDLTIKEGRMNQYIQTDPREYLHVYVNLLEIPAGYSVSEVKVDNSSLVETTRTDWANTGEYILLSNGISFQSKTAGLIEITVAK